MTTPKTETSSNSRPSMVNFTAAARAIRWLKNAPGVEDQNIQTAKKFMAITAGLKTNTLEFNQAKCTNNFKLTMFAFPILSVHLRSDLGRQ